MRADEELEAPVAEAHITRNVHQNATKTSWHVSSASGAVLRDCMTTSASGEATIYPQFSNPGPVTKRDARERSDAINDG